MKVFLSWSGDKSKHVAKALRDWLQNVIHAIDPWLSAEDMAKGSRWSIEIASQLNDTAVGIICVTPENQEAPWINFEAGALAKAVKQQVYVCPYLIGLTLTDLKGPLSLFQATEANEADTLQLLLTLNRALGEQARAESSVRQTFMKWWPDLQKELEHAASIHPSKGHERPQREILEEVLLSVRDMTQVIRSSQEESKRLANLNLGLLEQNLNRITQEEQQANAQNLWQDKKSYDRLVHLANINLASAAQKQSKNKD
jgi:hypothetical protein